MICLSHTTGYALRALACLENIDRRPSFIRDVAESTGVPRPYLARIINRLSHKGIVSAKRGYHGGVTLTRPAREVTLLEVVEAIEGEEWIGPWTRSYCVPIHTDSYMVMTIRYMYGHMGGV